MFIINVDKTQTLLYEFEMCLILILFTYFYIDFHRKTSEQNLFFAYIFFIMLFSHIIVSSILLSFIPGTFITLTIFILIITYIKNFNELLKRIYLIFGFGCYVYITSNIFNLLVFSLITLLIIVLIVIMAIINKWHRKKV